jgi:hypothetical protein
MMTVESPVLVLNAGYEPIAICQARRALTLLVKGAAASSILMMLLSGGTSNSF